ncbi:MAG: gliding motility-associated C-terminal domain-containing protein [Pedobacter sp.]|nr:MAG: gliding motility-associated C-terminal domain-containing protein [Pedobacter sp.]
MKINKLMRHIRLLYFLTLLLTLPFWALAQKVPVAPDMLFQVGGPNADVYSTNIKGDAQGNTYVTGRITDKSKTVDTYPSPGFNEFGYGGFLAKYSAAGALVWVKPFVGEASGLDIAPSGNVTVIGTKPSARPSPDNVNHYDDAFILHFDNNGNLLWNKVIKSGTKVIPIDPDRLQPYFDLETGYDVASDDAGNLVAVYRIGGSPDVDGIITAKGTYDGLVVKYDTNGNILWKFNLGSTGTTHNLALQALFDKGNNIIIAGYTDGTVDYNPLGTPVNVTAANTIFIAKYSPSGILLWIKTINANATKNNIKLALDGEDNIYINGSSSSTLDFGLGPPLPSKGIQDLFIAKYSAQGNLLYHKTMNGPNAIMLNTGLALGPDNSLYLTGNFFGKVDVDPSASVAELNSNGSIGLFLAKYDDNGNYQWAFRIPSIMGGDIGSGLGLNYGSDYYNRGVQDISVNNSSEIYLTGAFQYTVNFNGTGCGINSLTAKSIDVDNKVLTDMFVVRYTPTSEIPVTNNLATAPIVDFCPGIDPGIITGSIPVGSDFTYQWQQSSDNRVFTDIIGAVSKDFDPPVPSATTFYRRRLVTSECAVFNVSNVVTITLLKAATPNTITAPAELSFCNAGDVGFMLGSTPEAVGTVDYQWQLSTDKINFINIAGANRKDYDPPSISTTTHYRRVLTNTPCSIEIPSDTVTITVVSVPVPTVSAEQTVCIGNGVLLTATGGIHYSWSPAAGLSATDIASPTAKPNTTTNYTVTISNDNCVTTLHVRVIVIPKPIVNAGADKEIMNGDKLQLDAQVTDAEGATYRWTPITYLDNASIANPTANPADDITYRLTVKSANGCFIVSDEVAINVRKELSIPNAFSPNGDGINDVLVIAGLDSYKQSALTIFNRNGQQIFKSVAYLKPWDGTHNGKSIPTGTYYYIIELNNYTHKRLSGSIYLIK